MNNSCGSVSFGPIRLGGGLYSQDGINEAGLCEDLRQHHDYRSLPHKTTNLRGHHDRGYPNNFSTVGPGAPISNVNQYPTNYNSTASTPRRPQPPPRGGQHQQPPGSVQRQHYDRESLVEAEFSGASDNRSENTVIEQDRSYAERGGSSTSGGRRASNSRSILSNASNQDLQHGGQPGYLVVQGVGGPVAHVVGVEDDEDDDDVDVDDIDQEEVEDELIMDDEHGGPLSSEDNLSHDSYELIERVAGGSSSVVDLNKGGSSVVGVGVPPPMTSANQFEKEFYRQAAASAAAAKNGHNSSRTSSHCSLSMSPSVMKRKENGNASVEDIVMTSGANLEAVAGQTQQQQPAAVITSTSSNSMSRVKSADSFSQASDHSNINAVGSNLNKVPEAGEPEPVVISTEPPETSFTTRIVSNQQQSSQQQHHQQPQQVMRQDIIRGRGLSPAFVEVIDSDGQSAYLAPQFAHLMHHPAAAQQRMPDYTHSLPRANAEGGYIVYTTHPAAHPQQGILRGGTIVPAAGPGLYSRTLPNRRRDRSPVYYSRSRLVPGSHQECSSGSSSSHASPMITRPKSLEFAVVNVNALPNKQAYSYHDDSLDAPVQVVSNNHLMKPPMDLYDDSSSAMNEQLSSSDVPQTPENPNMTFLPLEAGPVIVGCHQGVVAGLAKKYYSSTEERIYDVPEGIEGISAPIKIRKPIGMVAVTSGSSATTMSAAAPISGGTGTLKAVNSNKSVTMLAPEAITSPCSSSSGITEPFVPQNAVAVATMKPAPTSAPPPPPHLPVIAQPVSRRPPRSVLKDSSKLPKVDIDPKKFHTLLSAMEPQDSTESCESNSIGPIHPHQRPMRPTRGRGSLQSNYSTTTLPPPQRALLATMSSTESESAMSARSAPTPISNPDILIRSSAAVAHANDYHDEYDEVADDDDEEDDDEDEYEVSDHNHHHRGKFPQFQVNLISPPAEDQSESSLTAVLDVPGCTPPPEFSGAAIINDEDPMEATDVEDESQTQSNATPKAANSACATPGRERPTEETTEADPDSKATNSILVQDGNSNPDQKTDVADNANKETTEEEEDEEEDDEASSKVIKVADLYVKIEHTNGSNGSTISEEGTTGSDIAPVPFIDEVKAETEHDLIEHMDGINEADVEIAALPMKQHAETVFIPSSEDTLESKSEDSKELLEEHEAKTEEFEDEAMEDVEPTADEPTKVEGSNKDLENPDDATNNATIDRLPSLPTFESNSSMDLPEHIPPPPTHCDLELLMARQKSSSVDSVSPPPPPPSMLLEQGSLDNGPPTAILTTSAEVGFPFPAPRNISPIPAPRALSRISEASNSARAASNSGIPSERNGCADPLDRGSRSGSETMTDQNCTTSEEGEEDAANPPSLNSDLPENVSGRVGGVMRAIAEFEARARVSVSENSTSSQANNTSSNSKSDHLPSPPSSLLNTTTIENVEDKTEVTMIEPDSLFLEIAPDPYVSTIDRSDEDLKDEDDPVEMVEGARDKVPYDLSISSENEVTNKEREGDNSEGSLHDSMEILEEVATEDHFDHDNDADSASEAEEEEEPRDIFEMPPMPNAMNESATTTENHNNESPPPSGGNEFIF